MIVAYAASAQTIQFSTLDEAGAERVGEAVDEGHHVAVAIGRGQVDGLARGDGGTGLRAHGGALRVQMRAPLRDETVGPLNSSTFQGVRCRHRPRNGSGPSDVRRSITMSANRGASPTGTFVFTS